MVKFDKLLLSAIAVLMIAFTASCSDEAVNEPVPESTVDTKPWTFSDHMDTSVAPGDDFLMY